MDQRDAWQQDAETYRRLEELSRSAFDEDDYPDDESDDGSD
jgi:hypothetical protein